MHELCCSPPSSLHLRKVSYLCMACGLIYADKHMTSTLKSQITQDRLLGVIVSNCRSQHAAAFVL